MAPLMALVAKRDCILRDTNGSCLEYDDDDDDDRPGFIRYIVAAVFVILIFSTILVLIYLSRRRQRRGQGAYYGTRWLFRPPPPAVPPRPGFPMNNYSAGGSYAPQQQGSYYPSHGQSPYYPPPNNDFQPAPMQSPYTTGSTYTSMPTSPGQAHVQPHYGPGGLRGGGGLEEELPPPPKYSPGPYGAQLGGNSRATETVREEETGNFRQNGVGK